MSEKQPTQEEIIFNQMKGNLHMSAVLIMNFLKEKQIPIDEYFKFAGEVAAKTWTGLKGKGAKSMLDGLSLNMQSFGSKVISLEGDEDKAVAIYSPWMSKELQQFGSLSDDEIDSTANMFKPVAESLELSLSWEKDGENLKVTVTK